MVLIDNDDLMRTVWSFAVEDVGLSIATYSCPNDFNKEIDKYRKETPIYIDSNLDDFIKGEQYAEQLYELGFTNLYLTTGYQPEQFEHLPWIKAIVGKEPPFYREANS